MYWRPSPIVRLNRTVAVGLRDGPEAGLVLLAELETGGELDGYPLLPAVRADLLRRAGRLEGAAAAYRQAIEVAGTEPERRLMERRLREVTDPPATA